MAESLNTTRENKKLNALAAVYKERLEQLGCPYTEGVEESWIVELIYQPGEHRIRLLQWIFSKFDSQLNDLLDPQFAPTDSKMDSRVQRLLFVASTLGLCNSDDADLIRGNTSVGKQMAFMDQLLDLVCIMDASEDPQAKAMQSPGTVSAGMSLDEQIGNDTWLADSLAAQEKIDQLFMNHAKLLPPDITKQIEITWRERGAKEGEKPSPPDIAKLAEAANEYAKDLKRQNEILEELKKNYEYPDTDPQTTDKVNKTVRLVLSEMAQLVVGFSYCYENEMKSWCNRSQPRLTQLGPAFKRVYNLLQHFTSLLESLGSVRGSYKTLCSSMSDRIGKLAENENKSGHSGKSALNSFKDCVDILEESLNRLNISGANTTTNLTLRSTIKSVK